MSIGSNKREPIKTSPNANRSIDPNFVPVLAAESDVADLAGSHCAGRPLVLHVRIVSGFGGGPEKTILNSPRRYQEHGYRSLCVYLHPPGDPGIELLRKRAAAAGAHLLSIPDRGPLDGRLVCKLAAICRRLKVAIWHGHDYKSNLLGLIVRRLHRMALVTTVHGWVQHTRRTPLYYAIDKWCLPHYDRVICVSDDLRETCRQIGVPSANCQVVYNAIDTDDFQRRLTVAVAKQRLGAPSEGLLIGAVGRLSHEKRFDLLIEAVARLRQAGHAVTLWIAGEGDERNSLEQKIKSLNCARFVRLIGHIDDPRAFYEALDLFALSSIREGLPNVVLEAMAMDVPVVATGIAGVPMLLSHGASGLVVKPGSQESLVQGIEQLIADPQLREDLRKAARTRVQNQFSFSHRTTRMVETYDDVLGRI